MLLSFSNRPGRAEAAVREVGYYAIFLPVSLFDEREIPFLIVSSFVARMSSAADPPTFLVAVNSLWLLGKIEGKGSLADGTYFLFHPALRRTKAIPNPITPSIVSANTK